MKVSLEKAERELARLWDEQARQAQSSRVELMTLVALVSDPGLLGRANQILAEVVKVHAMRTITCVWHPGDAPKIECDVMIHTNPDRRNEPCGDAIQLDTYGAGRDWLPPNIDRLLLSDLPAYVWWVGDLPDNDDLFDRMVRRADVVLVNSSEMDLRDIEKLAEIARASKDTYALLDLTWIRLRGLQDLVARWFDDPATRPYLDGLRNISIAYSPRANESDVASTRVGLFLGWLGTALSFKPETAKWTRDPKGGALTIERAGSTSPVTVRIEYDKREGVHDGSITRIQMICDGPRGPGKFELARDEAGNVRWTCDVPGVAVPSQTLQIGSHQEGKLLARQLERPLRDPLLESSLEIGYRMVKQVAPRLSQPPPPR